MNGRISSFAGTKIAAIAGGAAMVLAAASPALAYGWTTSGVIDEVMASDTALRVEVAAIASNPDSCPATGFFVLLTSHPNYQTLASILITARAAQQEVFFQVDGCVGNYPKIGIVYVGSYP